MLADPKVELWAEKKVECSGPLTAVLTAVWSGFCWVARRAVWLVGKMAAEKGDSTAAPKAEY